MKRALMMLVALCATYAMAAAPDWQDQRGETVREVWRFRDAYGRLTVGSGYRAFVSGADSADAENQADFTAIPSDSSYYLSSMRTGAPLRSGRYHIYKISPGADSLVYSYAYINGRRLGKYAVDDTSMADGVVLSRHIADGAVGAADVDTAVIPIKTGPVRLSQTLHVLGDATFDSWVAAYGFNDGATFSVSQDTTYVHAGAWVQHKLLVGSGAAGSHPDRLTVNGQVAVTGTSEMAGIYNTGSIVATTKIAASDSLNAYKSMRVGTPSTTGSVVMWNADGKKLTQSAPAGMAADRSITAFSFTVVDTFKLSRNRYKGGDRKTSKYVPGVLSSDIVIAPCMRTGGVLAFGMEWYCATDSVGFQWVDGFDNEVTSFTILRK